MAPQRRIDALVANTAASTAALYDAVTEDSDYLLTGEQLDELHLAQVQLSTVLYLESNSVEADEPEPDEGERDASSLTPDQEVARIEGDQRDEMNELPAP